MRIRLQDIAKDLNLSTMTISRVLRGQTDVSEGTKARVLQRMQELNYHPNISARGLRTGQAFRVGVLVPRMDDPYAAAVCQGLACACQAGGYGVAISVTEGDPEQEDAEFELHLSRQVDALFLIGSSSPREHDAGVPVFYLGRKPADDAACTVTYDEMEIGQLPVTHLLARGATCIAYLRGPRTAAADDRFRGFLKAHRLAGVAPRHEWVREVPASGSDYPGAFDAVSALLQQRGAPDAVMANSDALALGARDAALARGLRIPEDFQVVGCGNDEALCSVGLSLTSVAFPGEELGARAARLALKSIAADGGEPARAMRLHPDIVGRATTRSLHAAGRRARGQQKGPAEAEPVQNTRAKHAKPK